MPEGIISAIPLTGGVRRSRDADPFFLGEGELTDAKCAVFTEEGGVLQHGGVRAVATVPNSALAFWMYRWFRGVGSTSPFLVLGSDGKLYVSQESPLSTNFVLTVAQDHTTGSGVDISGVASTYYTVGQHSGWLYLCPNVTTDKFYRYDGTKFFQVGAVAPTVTPTLAVLGGGSFAAGTYFFSYTYVYGENGELGESNPSPINSIAVALNQAVNVTVTASVRTDVSAIRIYRGLVGASLPQYFVKEVTNTAGPHLVTDGDLLLSSANYEQEVDHNLPPSGRRSVQAYRERLWLILDDPRNRIHLSLVGQPDVFPNVATHYTDELNHQCAQRLTGGFTLHDRLYVTAPEGIWVLNGDTSENFFWSKLGDVGFYAERSIVSAQGGVFGLGTNDILIFDGQVAAPLRNIHGLVERSLFEDRQEALGVYRRNRYYLALKVDAFQDFNRIVMVSREAFPGSPQGFAATTFETMYPTPGLGQTFSFVAMDSWKEESERIFLSMRDGKIYEFDFGTSVSKSGEASSGAVFDVRTGWFFPAGPFAFNLFDRIYVALESDGSGGAVTLSWEIMDDNLNTLRTGGVDVPLLDSAGVGKAAVWNFDRWA
jgi:hypothetical protein